MKTQDDFVAARKASWNELDRLLAPESIAGLDGPSISRLAALYRALCTDLTRCRALRYTPDLAGYLDGLAARAHTALYGASPLRLSAFGRFFTRDFPRALRESWPFFAVASALFYVPFVIGGVIGYAAPDLATQILPSSSLEGMRQMYSDGFDAGRSEATDSQMAGFYVYNNIGIAFRCFATGVLAGLGSLFFLVYNGLVMGLTVGYVAGGGHGRNILTFVCGHGPLELTAIVIAGAAGLRMGYALVDTRGLTRIGSLRAAAPLLARLIMGAAAMLTLAAAVEGFWSPSSAPAPLKWAVSGVITIALTLYFVLAGRRGGVA